MAKIMTNMKKHFIKIVIVFYIVASSFFYYGYIDDINNNNEALIKSIPIKNCLLYTSPSPRDATLSRMPSSA